jgi:hypothetical protein
VVVAPKTLSGMTRSWAYVQKLPMVAILIQLFLLSGRGSRGRARLETENLILRQQLVALRRKSPKRVRLWNIDRLVFVWWYRLYPSLLDAIIIIQPPRSGVPPQPIANLESCTWRKHCSGLFQNSNAV